ncbi:MAG: hypothetical protein PHW32_03625 [Bacilli bacterium]|nr:hypothetical protein [Bacilli bacterium]MDD4282902.1 hypothetical protein [Bacilli bacterium]MDD4718689.1 hypothetical protein [Bacilli bacterium]
MKKEINVTASRHKRRKRNIKIIKLTLIVLILLLIVLYVVMGFVYNSGNFSITLDRNSYFEKNIIIYDDPDYKVFRSEMFAQTVESLDNISYKWLPDDIQNYQGSHNGENYIAYSFFVENNGVAASDYWSELIIVDSIKKVDEAIRVRVYRDGEYVTYAKMSGHGTPEPDTIPFTDDKLIALSQIRDFKPGDIHKYTVVIWIEGSDPECTDNILGGEIKIQMNFNSEFIEK